MPHRITLAGASGMPYTFALLKALVARQQQVGTSKNPPIWHHSL